MSFNSNSSNFFKRFFSCYFSYGLVLQRVKIVKSVSSVVQRNHDEAIRLLEGCLRPSASKQNNKKLGFPNRIRHEMIVPRVVFTTFHLVEIQDKRCKLFCQNIFVGRYHMYGRYFYPGEIVPPYYFSECICIWKCNA